VNDDGASEAGGFVPTVDECEQLARYWERRLLTESPGYTDFAWGYVDSTGIRVEPYGRGRLGKLERVLGPERFLGVQVEVHAEALNEHAEPVPVLRDVALSPPRGNRWCYLDAHERGEPAGPFWAEFLREECSRWFTELVLLELERARAADPRRTPDGRQRLAELEAQLADGIRRHATVPSAEELDDEKPAASGS
jgi:hypothetical protein